MIVLVTGGARSGKSRLAEERCLALAATTPRRAAYIATATAYDDEMRARIAAHAARRGPEWVTITEPLDLPRALAEGAQVGPILLDCLTLWLSNLMMEGRNGAAETPALLAALRACPVPVVLVSNELGMGIVPENALARAFRDAQGMLNQNIAALADEVLLAVSGLPLRVK